MAPLDPPAPIPGRVAILGATGFIGRWVAEAVNRRGDQSLLLGRDVGALVSAYAGTGGADGGRRFAAVDARDPETLRPQLDDFAPSLILNLAGYGVDRGERDEETASLVNATLPRWLAEWAAESGARLVHVGSALEYGTATGDLCEDTVPAPTTLYGRTKLAGTDAVTEVGARAGARVMTARLFTVYGLGEHAGRLLPSIIEARQDGRSLPLTEGLQRRDFAYVEDVADGLLCLADAPTRAGEVVNLATGVLTTVREFAQIAAEVLGVASSQLQFGAVPVRAEEMAHEPVSIARLLALTGWRPEPSLASGLARVRERLAERPTR